MLVKLPLDRAAPGRIIFSLLAFLLMLPAGNVASAQSGAEADIQKVYERFSAAYDSLDADMIAPLYADSALYVTSNPEEGVRRGRAGIIESFRGQFASARKRGSRLAISFRIIERAVDGDMAYDVGYYKFSAFPEEGDTFEAAGKFVAVLRRGADGQWRFQVDGFNPAPLSAYENATEVDR